MRIAGSIITLICGIVVIVGIFLAWYEYCEGAWGWEQCVTVSGWNFGDWGDWAGTWVVLGGGVLMTVCALPAFIVSLASKGGRAAIVTLGIFAMLGALVAIGGCIWYIVEALDSINWYGGSIAYGLYITAAAAVLGFIFAILTAAFSKGRQDW